MCASDVEISATAKPDPASDPPETIGYVLIDEDGRICEASHAFCLWLGYSRADLIKRAATDVIKDKRIARRFMREILFHPSPDTIVQEKVRLVNFSGYNFESSINWSIVNIDSYRRLAVFVRVPAQAHRNEHTLQEAHRFVQQLVDNAGVDICYLDSTGHFRFVNRHMIAKLSGGDPSKEGKSVLDVFGPHHGQRILDRVQQVFQYGRGLEFHDTNEAGLGGGQTHSVYSPLVDRAGVITGVEWVSLYIHRPRAAKTPLLPATDLLQSFFENSPIGVAVFDHQLKLRTANSLFRSMTGAAAGTETAPSFSAIFGTRELRPLIAVAKRIVGGGLERHVETITLGARAFGNRSQRITLVAFREASTNQLGLLFVSLDITEQVQAAATLRKTTDELQKSDLELRSVMIAWQQVTKTIEDERRVFRHEMCESIRAKLDPILKQLREQRAHLPARVIAQLEELVQKLSEDMYGLNLQELRTRLTPREMQICELIRAGKTSKQIAVELNLSVLTVDKHRQLIRRRLNLKNTDLKLFGYLWREP